MVRPFHERQAGDDLRRLRAFQRQPPGIAGREGDSGQQAKIAGGSLNRLDHPARADMRHEGW